VRLLRYLFITLLVTGVAWGFRHQGQLPATVRPIAILGQLGTARQAPAAGSAPALALSPRHHALYYTPEVNPERVDVPLLTKARGHIDAAFYSFTDKPTAVALLAAANRGVKVRIYRDQEQFQEEKRRNPYMTTMFAGNRNVQIRVKGSRALMHLKAWSTEGLLRDGSSNLSAAAKHQDNSLVLSSDADEIQAFEKKFAEMWNRPDNIVIQ
jgi:phosphatidylserine/phosphatidylglycerophosphate/cardiolipin synthase-like enzyme